MLSFDHVLFFAGYENLAEQYDELRDRLAAQLPPFSETVQKTQITWRNRHVFLCVSIPRRKQDAEALLLSFGLPHRIFSERIWRAVEPYPNRWTHHVLLRDVREQDDELISWIQAAYAFSEQK